MLFKQLYYKLPYIINMFKFNLTNLFFKILKFKIFDICYYFHCPADET